MYNYGILQKLFGLMLLIILMAVNAPVSARDSPMTVASGLVLDAAGGGVTDATVFLRGQEMIYSLKTQADGRWSVGELPSGWYELYAVGSSGEAWSTPRQVELTGQDKVLLTLASPDNVIQGGDFEGDEVWQSWQKTNNLATLSSDAFSGQSAAHMGESLGEPVTCSQNGQSGQLWSLQQNVIVPASDQATLSFVAKIDTSQNAFNYAWLEVVLLVDGQPHYLMPWGQLWQKADWTLHAFDLTAWRGQLVTVLFQAVNCATDSFTVNLDRVNLGTQVPNQNLTPIATATVAITPNPNGTPTPIHTPTNPNATYLATVRQLTACENQGNHHLFIYVLDAAGNGIPNVRLRVSWPGKEVIIETGTKMENPGLVDFPMFKGNYWVEVLDGSSDKVGPLTPDIPQDVACEETDNPVGNSLYHYSYRVTFTKK